LLVGGIVFLGPVVIPLIRKRSEGRADRPLHGRSTDQHPMDRARKDQAASPSPVEGALLRCSGSSSPRGLLCRPR
jgi:hypothetical protein